ncbi:hypothetical protein Ga0100231_002260 [Opitutaceae bacterium TAV4]|nr:hypothetical protein Ga0100231_002260 [Opitutaceae bacterium TAV4]RRK01782.1 hypothetical protein Ga0100230_000450 [Opitutaceae bacterium TAV3]
MKERTSLWAYITLLLSLFALAAPVSKAATVLKLQPDKYPEALILLTNGTETWSPMSGFGPIVLDQGKSLNPGSYEVKLRSSNKTPSGDTRLVYRVTNVSQKTEFAIVASQDAQGITLTIEGLSGIFRGVSPGTLLAAPEIIGFAVPKRTSEDYPQHGRYPDTFYNRKVGVWLRGAWDLDFGNAGSAETLYPKAKQAEGIDAVFFPGLTLDDGAKAEALNAYHLDQVLVYVPLRDGKRWPLTECFRLDFSPNLWGAVAEEKNKPSEYRDQTRKLLYLDLWGGFYEDRSDFTQWLQATVGKWVGGLSIVQDWQGGGFDSNLPLSIADDLPPNPRKAGTPEQLKAWMNQMKSWGLAGLRTNYQYWRDTPHQPVNRAINLDGSPKWHTQAQEVMPVIKKQENYIQSMLSTTATFSDQLTSGGVGWPYVEFTAKNPNVGTIRGARQALRDQAQLIKSIVKGPLLSESLNTQFLIGADVDSGDYGMFEGFQRMFTPEFKLRRLHHLTTFYGMGLGYRYFFAPPYAPTNRQNQGNAMYAYPWGSGSDDYRAMTIAFGNAAYLDYLSAEGMHPDKAITEAMTVGLLQIYYVGEPVKNITYQTPDGWKTLEELLLEGKNPKPFYARIRVDYKNGLTVVINRSEEVLPWTLPKFGAIRLPKHAYLVYTPDGAVEGFSGFPGATGPAERIDYTRDDKRNVIFINPRATGYKGLVAPTIFENGEKVYELPPERRLRSRAVGTFEDTFTNSLTWVFNKAHKVTITKEGKDSFVRIESDGKPVRLDKPIGLTLAGTIAVRYRTNSTAQTAKPSANIALMRFGMAGGSVRELPGRKAFVLPDTKGEWVEAAYPFSVTKEDTRHVILRLAASDSEVPGVTPASSVVDIDYIRIDPKK